MDLPTSPETALVDPDEAEILASFRALPTENDLPCDDGEPLETPRHREQMHLLIEDNHVRLTSLPPCRSNARAANFNASWTASTGRL